MQIGNIKKVIIKIGKNCVVGSNVLSAIFFFYTNPRLEVEKLSDQDKLNLTKTV